MGSLSDGVEQQQAAIDFRGGNVYVGAGPGTGKTYVLIERYRALREGGVPAEKILILTFSRRAVTDLRERIGNAGFSERDRDIRTFHGFAARVLGGGVPNFRDRRLLDGFSREVLLDTAIAQTPTPSVSAGARTSQAFRSEVNRLIEELGRVSPVSLEAIARKASPRLADVLRIHAFAASARATIGGSDIGDLVSRALAEVRRPESRAARWLAGRYAHVLVDEFQDTDRMQLDLLACLGAEIFAVGDEAQSIYRFRGASDDIVTEALTRFAMTRFDLTVSRRCPPEVCELASSAPIPNLTPLRSAHASGAPVEVMRLRALDDEVAYLADAIEADINAGVPAAKIAVLLRAFRPLGPLLIDELRRRGIAVVSTGREELLADARISTLRAALDVLADPGDTKSWIRLLTSGPLHLDPIAIRFATEAIDQLRLDSSLAPALQSLCRVGALNGTELAAALFSAAEAWHDGNLGVAARRLVVRLRLIADVMNAESPETIRSAGQRLTLVCDALAGAQQTARSLGAPAGCRDIMTHFENYLPSLALDDAGFDTSRHGVRVLTVHAAKGLEFGRVFIADAVQGRFPQDERVSGLLTASDRALLEEHQIHSAMLLPGGAATEEASLWYVALTRCQERLSISFSDRGLSGDMQRPSRFIPADLLPATARSLDRESLLMRAMREQLPIVGEILTSGALDLAPTARDVARLGQIAIEPFEGAPLELVRSLSVGDAETWLQCPRKLFYKKFLKLRDEQSAVMLLGSAIHATLERFHAVRHTFAQGESAVSLWESELLALRAEHWQAADFPSPIVAQAAARAADVALRGYARELEGYASQQAFEVEFREEPIEVPVGPFSLVGKVDRVDKRSDGSRVILDYKRGSASATPVVSAIAKITKEWDQADEAGEPRQGLARRAPSELKLQLALYATAFEAVKALAYVFLGGAAKTERRNGAYVEMMSTESVSTVRQAALLELEHDLLGPLAGGTLYHLPVTLSEKTCTYCSYSSLCSGPEDMTA